MYFASTTRCSRSTTRTTTSIDPTILPPWTRRTIAATIATGPRASGASFQPDLYDHLREDIEIAAGRLARVELEFGVPMFDLRGPPRPPTSTGTSRWRGSVARCTHPRTSSRTRCSPSTATHAGTVAPVTDDRQEMIGLRHAAWQRDGAESPASGAGVGDERRNWVVRRQRHSHQSSSTVSRKCSASASRIPRLRLAEAERTSPRREASRHARSSTSSS